MAAAETFQSSSDMAANKASLSGDRNSSFSSSSSSSTDFMTRANLTRPGCMLFQISSVSTIVLSVMIRVPASIGATLCEVIRLLFWKATFLQHATTQLASSAALLMAKCASKDTLCSVHMGILSAIIQQVCLYTATTAGQHFHITAYADRCSPPFDHQVMSTTTSVVFNETLS